jgi:hypothetical protein
MEMSLQIKLAVHAIVSYSISEQNKHTKVVSSNPVHGEVY